VGPDLDPAFWDRHPTYPRDGRRTGRTLTAVATNQKVDLNQKVPRWLVIFLVVYALFFLASATVAKELVDSLQFVLAIAVISVTFFMVMIFLEIRRAFRLGADAGEAVAHGLMHAFRGFVGMRPKEPPKY
jgi:hypothetical protein